MSTAALGCYGNDWIETPTFDELATVGLTFHGCFGEGRVGGDPVGAADLAVASLLIQEAGTQPDGWLGSVPKITVEGETGLTAKPSQSPFAVAVQTAREHLRDSQLRLLAIHSRGVPTPWLPPEDLVSLYFDEFEERGADFENLTAEDWGRLWPVYASYVSLLDHWLGELWKDLKEVAASRPVLLIVTGRRGSAVETRLPPPDLPQVNLHQLQRPLVVATLGQSSPWSAVDLTGAHLRHLIDPRSIEATVAAALGAAPPGGNVGTLFDVAAQTTPPAEELRWKTDDPPASGIINPDWSYVQGLVVVPERDGDMLRMEDFLFSRPDDPNHLHDVAHQYPEIAEAFRRRHAELFAG